MSSTRQWLLLLHQVPPSPPYLRAKILRRLKQIGALALKNSAYLLPDSEDATEDFQWLMREIRTEGGEAWVLRTEAVAGLTDESVRESFQELRSADYRELLAEARSIEGQIQTGGTDVGPNPEASLRKLKKRFEEVNRIDFFDAPGKQEVLVVMNEIEQSIGQRGEVRPVASGGGFNGRTWVTRRGIKIDRTTCCWL